MAAALLLLLNLFLRKDSEPRNVADVLRAILTVVVATAAIRAGQLRRDEARRLDAVQSSLTLTPLSAEERPSILIYRTADDREARRRQMELLDVFVAAKWDAQAPDEILTNPPALTGLGWVRFRGPRTQEESGRSVGQQATLETTRKRWQGQLQTALQRTQEPCGIDDPSGGNTVQDRWLGYIYVGPASGDCPRKESTCDLIPGKLRTVSPEH